MINICIEPIADHRRIALARTMAQAKRALAKRELCSGNESNKALVTGH